jgi:phosphoglycolate phosphatase-like HAD superfamily hydrolase
MFDIDGTLIKSNDFDSECFVYAVEDVLRITIDDDWSKYKNSTDAGILDEIIIQHQLQQKRDLIHSSVKIKFFEFIAKHLDTHQVLQVKGAMQFISKLRAINNVVITIATGGWKEAAEMKLKSAGIDISGIPIATSSDHYSRTEIMKLSEIKGGHNKYESKTYFGDAVWDKQAAEELGYNFILVGNKTCHNQTISDFSSVDDALNYIGL